MSGLSFPPPGDLQGFNPHLLHWQATFFHCATREAQKQDIHFPFAKEISFSKGASSTTLIYHAFLTHFLVILPQFTFLEAPVPFSCLVTIYCAVGIHAQLLSHVQLSVITWIVAYQAPLLTKLSWQEYWSGLPFPSPGDLPNPGIKPKSPALQPDSLLYEPARGNAQRRSSQEIRAH